MKGKAFLDTNLFVYMQSSSDINKKELSFKALESFDCMVSTQVLNEFCNIAVKKLNMKPEQVEKILFAIENTCEIAVITFETIKKALRIKEKYGYSYYDSLILSSALEYDNKYLFSEDMKDGQIIDNCLEIVNIFFRNDF